MTAEAIAAVVADLRAGRVRTFVKDERTNWLATEMAALDGPVVDATALYRAQSENPREIAIYEDHNIAPPWESALIAYRNEHGNVMVMPLFALEHDLAKGARWEANPDCRWEDVRWIVRTFIFLGGTSNESGPFPTAGPVHAWDFAVYADGEIGDIHWTHLMSEYPMTHWDMAQCVLLGAMTFLTCRNVELVEPIRPRGERRRIARTGVQVHELVVFPTGKATRSRTGERLGGTPLTSVRGHWAKYGPQYGRGLLFGKYAGRFWVPVHARGSAEHGESRHDYRIEVPE